MQWKTRPLGYFSYTVFCCLCKRGDLWPPASAGLSQISIHAPARGATGCIGRGRERLHYFNSRPCERGDSPKSSGLPWGKFQFTPLREGRPIPPFASRATSNFNSRPCERGDGSPDSHLVEATYFNSRPCERGNAKTLKSSESLPISIHAPARGATIYQRFLLLIFLFQFTPLREGRPVPGGKSAGRLPNFNSRPCERGDSRIWPRRSSGPYFNSRPCERGDAWPHLASLTKLISIHAPARGAT